jgi:asparagine synthase (glutamine-hydrolysing)
MVLTGCSLWEALKQMHRTRRRFRGRYAIDPQRSLLNSRKFEEGDITFEHPWLDAPPGTPIGKVVHVAMLQRIHAAIDGFPRAGAPLVLPLISQPIMETCLSIPTWRWCTGGHNRSVARRAYAAILPEKLIYRRSKGGPSRFAYRAVETNRNQLKDLLLGGLLAENGLLDLAAIETLFKGSKEIPAAEYIRLTLLAEAETWARQWT